MENEDKYRIRAPYVDVLLTPVGNLVRRFRAMARLAPQDAKSVFVQMSSAAFVGGTAEPISYVGVGWGGRGFCRRLQLQFQEWLLGGNPHWL